MQPIDNSGRGSGVVPMQLSLGAIVRIYRSFFRRESFKEEN